MPKPRQYTWRWPISHSLNRITKKMWFLPIAWNDLNLLLLYIFCLLFGFKKSLPLESAFESHSLHFLVSSSHGRPATLTVTATFKEFDKSVPPDDSKHGEQKTHCPCFVFRGRRRGNPDRQSRSLAPLWLYDGLVLGLRGHGREVVMVSNHIQSLWNTLQFESKSLNWLQIWFA